jgi:uncharacterized protein YjbI with pentapeptide repeats
MSVNETDDLTELRLWLVRLVVGFIALVAVALLFLWCLNVTPLQQVEGTLEVKDFFALKNQAIKSVIEAIKIIATVFGGIAILLNVYYGAKRAKALEKNAIAATQNAIAATKNAEVAEQGLITERFTKAIEQLGSDNISIRLGGIYALERIAKDSERDHWTIMEVLSAFVRENAPLKEDLEAKKAEGEQQPQKLHNDIQAALTVIGRRNTEKDPENQRLDLSKVNIAGAELMKAQLQGAFLYEANLQKANLIDANLQGVNLNGTNLQGVNLKGANLQGAFLNQANLQRAELWGAELQKAKLQRAKLERAVLNGAELQGATLDGANLEYAYLWYVNLQQAQLKNTNLEGAFLNGAELQGATLDGANLKGAFLNRANLEGVLLDVAYLKGADLSEAKNLESWQLETAFGDSTTLLPDGIEAPARWLQSGE